MIFQQRIKAVVNLGQTFEKWVIDPPHEIETAYIHNNWFTKDNVIRSFKAWAEQLSASNLEQWLRNYAISEPEPKQIAIIMAGNIPLVGLHDLLCVWLSGYHALVKLASDDSVLMKMVIKELLQSEGATADDIVIIPEQLPKNYDAVIATGSNNTNRYFEYYFKGKPHVLRKNRSSVAILTGDETAADFALLAQDIFTYFGLGCRNVSKLYVPEGYDFTPFFESINHFHGVLDHNKYANNYTYHKSIFLMNLTKHLDNGFLLVKDDTAVSSPLSVLFYETYTSREALDALLLQRKEEIQCVVGKGLIPFGGAQQPQLWDYADGVDTLAFLLKQ